MSNENTLNAASLAADIAKHCASFEQSPEYAEMISRHVRQLYEKTIEDVFRWGDFQRDVRKALESALPANISNIVDLPRYNVLLAKELAAQWESSAVSDRLSAELKETVIKFVKSHEVPKYIFASDLWAAFIEDHKATAAEEGWRRPEVLMEHSDHGGFWVGLEKAPHSDSGLYANSKKTYVHQFNYNLYFARQQRHEPGRGWINETVHGNPLYRLYAGRVDEDTLGKQVVRFRGRFDKLVAALYYGDSLLVLDEDDTDSVVYPTCD